MKRLIPDLVAAYLRRHPDEESALFPLLKQLAISTPGEITSRRTLPGHVTASGVVVSPNAYRSVLLVEHRTLGLSLFPGGHCEQGEPPIDAAHREVLEEVGLTTVVLLAAQADVPFDIDCHIIPANARRQEREHWHFDFRFVLQAPICHEVSLSLDEVKSAVWVTLEDLAERHPRVARKLWRLIGAS